MQAWFLHPLIGGDNTCTSLYEKKHNISVGVDGKINSKKGLDPTVFVAFAGDWSKPELLLHWESATGLDR